MPASPSSPPTPSKLDHSLLLAPVVGLARPLTAEPRLTKELIDGAKTAAKPNKVPDAVQTGTSIVQIGAIAEGKPIPDLADEQIAKDTLDALMGKKPASKPDQNTASYEKGDEKDKN